MQNCLRFDTSAALAGALIPAGMESLVIEKFDASSAVSAARYIQVESDPGHDLSVLNVPGSTWWAVHPDHLSLEAAGAPADVSADCVSAMQRVLDYLVAAGRAKLQLRERDYVLKSRATLAQSSGDPPLSFSMVGRGPSASRLLVQYPDNQAGAFALRFADNRSEFVARDFSVIATGAGGPNAGCGTAMRVEFAGAPDAGRSPAQSAVFADVLVGSDEMSGEGVFWSFFATGIDITGESSPSIHGCTITGPTGSNAAASVQDAEDGPLGAIDDGVEEARGRLSGPQRRT